MTFPLLFICRWYGKEACPADSSSKTQYVKFNQEYVHISMCVLVDQIACYRGKYGWNELARKSRGQWVWQNETSVPMYSFHPGASALMERQLKK